MLLSLFPPVKLHFPIFIPPDKLNGVEDGEKVVVRFVRWDGKKPEGEVVGKLNARHEADLAMKEILIEKGFPLAFEKDVMEEAMALSDEISKKELKRRKDFRDVLTFTIDPADAKDFDDAISFRVLDNGHFEIGIHIADVSHFVLPGTNLDKAAYERATSVYLPDRVSPMLPERISNELCSLRPNEDKFTFSAVVEMNQHFEIKKKWVGRTLIHSDHRFTYEEVQQILESKSGMHAEVLILLDTIAKKYRADRFKEGAINFSSEEFRFVVNDEGMPVGIVVKESKDSHQLIEEFMLLANRIVAEMVSKVKVDKEPVPFAYRVHGTPDEEKLAPFVAFARKMGYTFDLSNDAAIAKSFNLLLYAVKGKPEEHVLEKLGIRTMAKAIYSTENEGHYGLGFEHYCHFTSPIRRYPDVLVHRVVQQVLDKEVHPDKKMEQKCVHCSSKERDAMDAERSGNKYMQVVYMEKYLGEEFEAIVTGVSTFGFWAETLAHKCEGLVSIRELVEFDEFRHDAVDYQLVGTRTGKRFRIGDKVVIKVLAANKEKRNLDYGLVLAPASADDKQ